MLIIVEAKRYRREAKLSIFFMISFSSHFSSERNTIAKNGVTRVAWRVRRSENEKCDANFDVCLYVLIRPHSTPVTFIYSAFILQAAQFSCEWNNASSARKKLCKITAIQKEVERYILMFYRVENVIADVARKHRSHRSTDFYFKVE